MQEHNSAVTHGNIILHTFATVLPEINWTVFCSLQAAMSNVMPKDASLLPSAPAVELHPDLLAAWQRLQNLLQQPCP